MQITKPVLHQALSAIMPAIESKPNREVMSNILLEVEDGTLYLTATDNEIELQTKTDISADDIKTTIPAQKLYKIVSTLPDSAVIKFDFSDDQVIVKSGRSRFKLATLPHDDFPIVEDLTNPVTVTIPQSELRLAIERTMFAMANGDVRYYLNGMLFEIGPSTLTAVATDGHRLAKTSHDVETDQELSVILPRKSVLSLVKMLDDGDLDLSLTKTHAQAQIGNLTFTSRLIDGKFPDYSSVIPDTANASVATIDVDALRQALTRTAITANETYKGVRLDFAKNLLTLTTDNPRHENGTEELEIDYAGDDVGIGANHVYLQQALMAVDSTDVLFNLFDQHRSMVVEPTDDSVTRYVVMPMRI